MSFTDMIYSADMSSTDVSLSSSTDIPSSTNMSSLWDSCWMANCFFYRYAVPNGTFQNLPVEDSMLVIGSKHIGKKNFRMILITTYRLKS
jgi:hypothetical protein